MFLSFALFISVLRAQLHVFLNMLKWVSVRADIIKFGLLLDLNIA